MPEHLIEGVTVEFPFEPYDLQRAYMGKVINCLDKSENAVLESPTGTGKTLCLLCSSLAWLKKRKQDVHINIGLEVKKLEADGNKYVGMPMNKTSELSKNLQEVLFNQQNQDPTSNKPWNFSKIIYASRTHSQLTQAMKELKRTAYKNFKSVSLGGREQLCINAEVLAEKTSAEIRAACRVKVDSKQCSYFGRVEKTLERPEIVESSVMDIEDLIRVGKKCGACPFYLSKQLIDTSDIAFMPYNYLLDPKVRKANKLVLDNAVIILDEAHNIEKMCEESASVQITSTDIALCIDDISHIMKVLSDNEASVEFAGDDKPTDFSLDDLATLKGIILEFEQAVDGIEVQFSATGTTFNGSFMFELLLQAGIKHDNSYQCLALFDALIIYLSQSAGSSMYGRKGTGIQKMNDLLTVVFSCQEKDIQRMEVGYKVHVMMEEQKSKTSHGSKQNDNWFSKTKQTTTKLNAKVVNYWCFNPGFGMEQLLGNKIHSIILTSGTLAPLKPLIGELGIPIHHRLENPHIVGKDQVCVKIVSQGPDKEPLISNYQNRDNPKYLQSMGRTILALCRVIPHGLLVFFPSYPVMNKNMEAWQASGVWSDIVRIKPIFVEPRTKEEFLTTIDGYYQQVNDLTGKGAIFMAVCRGKVSEGLDFTDNNGRAVIITGLPYPPLLDPRVVLKKKYLDTNRTKENGLLSGNDWYSLEATRAVNQAIGRVIRHKDDYGAILLCDSRFHGQQQKTSLSSWIQTHLRQTNVQDNNFGLVIRDLSQFFRNAGQSHPVTVKERDVTTIKEEPSYFTEDEKLSARKQSENVHRNQMKIENSNEIYGSTRATASIFLPFGNPDKFKKEKEEPKTFFGALNKEVETINFNNVTESTSSLVTIHQKPSFSEDGNASKKRKFVMVANKEPASNGSAIPMKVFRFMFEKVCPEDRGDFLKVLKQTLDYDAYKLLLKALNNYQTEKNFDHLFKSLLEILNDPEKVFIITGIRRFLKPEHKIKFDKLMLQHFQIIENE
ncbi:unnamed protein product [Diamesa serratosioi]